MADICVVSASERAFIIGGVGANIRSDGRSRNDFRSFSLDVGVVSSANGSARVRLEQTEVLVGLFFVLWTFCFYFEFNVLPR